MSRVEQVDSEWYRGTCRGSTGYFPVNYVKVLVSLSALVTSSVSKNSLNEEIMMIFCFFSQIHQIS